MPSTFFGRLKDVVTRPFQYARGALEPVKSQADIVRQLARGLQARVVYARGRGMQRGRRLVPGRYWMQADVAEVRRAADYTTTYHELGHALDENFDLRTYLVADPAAARELMRLGRSRFSSAGPGACTTRLLQEGSAELLRRYLEEPHTLPAALSRRWEQWMDVSLSTPEDPQMCTPRDP